jgi:hypothetical protein
LPREEPGAKQPEAGFVEFRIATQAADRAAEKRAPQ